MWLRTSCELSFDIETPTPFIMMLRPRSGAQQWIEKEEYIVSPSIPIVEFSDDYGNLCQRLIAPIGKFTIKTTAQVKTTEIFDKKKGAKFIEIEFLPDTVLKFLLPSRYCESDRFSQMAHSIIENAKPGYNQVECIEKWIRKNVSYIPGSSDFPLSAIETNQRGLGVCRDLAHMGIALCRSINIPARMVVGYLYNLDPMDMHAWFEAYVGNRWYTFDPTQAGEKGGYVSVGYGRDASDLAVYNQFGPSIFPLYQEVKVEKIE